MINRQVYASRGTQNVPFFRTNLTLIPGLPAIATVSPGDIKVLTPPELAKESVEDAGVIPIESAVKPSEEVGDLSNVAAEISEVHLRILCLGCQSTHRYPENKLFPLSIA